VGRDFYLKYTHILVLEREMMAGLGGNLDFGSGENTNEKYRDEQN
jgi:hypothetical protein